MWVEEKSNHLWFIANAIGKQFVWVSYTCRSTSQRKMLVHYKDKCWKNKPRVPTVLFSCWHAVKPNYWSFTRCWAAQGVLSLGCHYFIDTSDVFLIYNHTAITHQLCNHYDGFAECAFWFELIERPNIFFFNVIEIKTAQGLQKHSLLADILGTPARASSLI